MRIKRLLSLLLKVLSSVAVVASLFSGLMFYEFYFKWRSLFNEEGRYFDPQVGVVYHDDGFVWGVLSLALFLMSITLWLFARKFTAGNEIAR